MGTLIAKKYPTTLFAKAADHTYVECSTGGKGWRCWGGKTGGSAFRQGPASTRRADSIAQPDEKANIRCYLVNGVCHQAANRILIPARIIVSGARGYGVSQALYGTYGRVGYWPCRSPFNQYPGVSGDLSECAAVTMVSSMDESEGGGDVDEAEMAFVSSVLELYQAHEGLFGEEKERPAREEVEEFDLAHFSIVLEYRLGPLDERHKSDLMDVRRDTEGRQLELERRFAEGELEGREFVEAANQMTKDFQMEMGERMSDAEYERLFELRKDEVIVLADPQIVSEVFGE